MTFFYSIKVSSIAIGLISLYAFPVITAMVEPFVFKEKFELKHILASFFLLFGIYIVVPEFNLDNSITQGVFWGVLSAFCVTASLFINRQYVKTYSSITISFYKYIVSSLFLIPFLLTFDIEIFGENINIAKEIILLVLGQTLSVKFILTPFDSMGS